MAFALLSGGGDGNGGTGRERQHPDAAGREEGDRDADRDRREDGRADGDRDADRDRDRDRDGEPDEPSGSEPAGNNPAQLQLQAYNLNRAGKSEEALPVAQKAVRLGCKGNAAVSPCGYALFELAKAQRGTGDAEAAIKTLEERLQRYPDDQRAAVEAELKRARADAGQ